MQTFKSLKTYFQETKIPQPEELEPKEDLKKFFTDEFTDLIKQEIDPVFAFHLLYHRLNEIANVAKDVFYQPAIDALKTRLDDENTIQQFGASITLKTSNEYNIIKSPKITKLEKEISNLEKKNKKIITKYQQFQDNVKSIHKQIKAEEERIIKTGMAKKISEKNIISFKY